MAAEGNKTQRTKKQRAFLAAFAEAGSITKAAEVAKVDRTLHYRAMENEEYAADFRAAGEQAADRLEEEARRRAHDGVEEPVYYKGGVVGAVQKYSDTLLIFLLKGRRPGVFGDKVKLSGDPNAPLHAVVSDGSRRTASDPS